MYVCMYLLQTWSRTHERCGIPLAHTSSNWVCRHDNSFQSQTQDFSLLLLAHDAAPSTGITHTSTAR
jgi:hypothetical protein